ncbi:MAG: haloacid dehalogenase-like hydrolase [Paludibacteraceae bacterium]|nr:haloacid dehalogenase-like hydrolase [Paludibacteraceae bacterium]
MKQLYAYDFDETLIPYDSFRRYLWHLVRKKTIAVGVLLLFRKLRVITSGELKKRISDMVLTSPVLQIDAEQFAKSLLSDIQNLEKFYNSEILIISASPMVYMQYLAEDLQCSVVGSDYINGNYVEMYGDAKANYIYEHYPKSEYTYTYAISDSESDLCWMKDFEKYELIQ